MFPGETWEAKPTTPEAVTEPAKPEQSAGPKLTAPQSVEPAMEEAEQSKASAGNPRVELRKYLKQVREERLAKKAAAADKREDMDMNQRLEKPMDWGMLMLVPVSADMQEPPKQRGRKPKMSENDAEAGQSNNGSGQPVDPAAVSKEEQPVKKTRKNKKAKAEVEVEVQEPYKGEQKGKGPKQTSLHDNGLKSHKFLRKSRGAKGQRLWSSRSRPRLQDRSARQARWLELAKPRP